MNGDWASFVDQEDTGVRCLVVNEGGTYEELGSYLKRMEDRIVARVWVSNVTPVMDNYRRVYVSPYQYPEKAREVLEESSMEMKEDHDRP